MFYSKAVTRGQNWTFNKCHSQNGNVQQCLPQVFFGGDTFEMKSIINQLLFVCLWWSATLADEKPKMERIRLMKRHRQYNVPIPFTAPLYLSVCLPHLIFMAKVCVSSLFSAAVSICNQAQSYDCCCYSSHFMTVRMTLPLFLLHFIWAFQSLFYIHSFP